MIRPRFDRRGSPATVFPAGFARNHQAVAGPHAASCWSNWALPLDLICSRRARLEAPATASSWVMLVLNVARPARSCVQVVGGVTAVLVVDAIVVLVLVDVLVLVLVLVVVDVLVDVLVLVLVGVEVVVDDEVGVEVLVEDVDTAPAKVMWWAADRLSNWSVRLARITHGVRKQFTTWLVAVVNTALTVNGTGMVWGSLGVNGALIGLNSPLAPVVKGTVWVSHRVRSAVHSRSVPPVVLAPKWRPVTCTV